jgi:hypothetical protein
MTMLFFLFPAGSCDQTIKVTAASGEPKEQRIFFASAHAIFPPARWHCSEKKKKVSLPQQSNVHFTGAV